MPSRKIANTVRMIAADDLAKPKQQLHQDVKLDELLKMSY